MAFGMQWSIPDHILERRLRWLRHVGRMKEVRLPKVMLFRELTKKDPSVGPRRGGGMWSCQIYRQLVWSIVGTKSVRIEMSGMLCIRIESHI